MRVIPIRWTDLEIAFERNAPGIESFLDVRTGDVTSILADAPGAPEQRARIVATGDAFIRVEPASSREQYRWMERFVSSVTDDALRERLLMSIDGKGAFRRFKDVLLTYPVERERWFSYRAELLHWHIQEWLKREELTPTEPPPWGQIERPPELDVVLEKPPLTAETPGESLRRQARDLLEQLPVLEMPSAIAFLEFLRDRHASEIARRASSKTDPGPAGTP